MLKGSISPVRRFRDESIGGIRTGPLKGEQPEETVIYYQAGIQGATYSGIRVFSRISKFVTFFFLKEKELKKELSANWERVLRFLDSSPAYLAAYIPKRLTLVYGFVSPEEFNYSAVFTYFGTFTFIEADTEDAVSFGLPVRDIKGMDFVVASSLFTPTFHSYLSLRILNLIGS